MRLKKVVAIGLGKVLFVFCAVARNASSVAGGIDASSSVVLTRDGRTLSSFIFSTMLSENGGSTAVAQEEDTESVRHERLTRMCILIGRLYEFLDRSHPSRGCCGRLLREGGSSHYAIHPARIARVRVRTVTSYRVVAGTQVKKISQRFHYLVGDLTAYRLP